MDAPLLEDQRRARHPDQQLERRPRQSHRLQQQLPQRAVRQGLRGRGSAAERRRQRSLPVRRCDAAQSRDLRPRDLERRERGARRADDLDPAAIRPLNMPKADPAAIDAGAVVFGTNCASCHGGAKWTKSQVFYLNNPSFVMGQARDPGLTINAAQVISYTDAKVDHRHAARSSTRSAPSTPPIRSRSAARVTRADHRSASLGFNTPTMLGVNYSPPYFHNGSAETLEDVFAIHLVAGRRSTTCSDEPNQSARLPASPSTAARTSSSPRPTASRIRSRTCSALATPGRPAHGPARESLRPPASGATRQQQCRRRRRSSSSWFGLDRWTGPCP